MWLELLEQFAVPAITFCFGVAAAWCWRKIRFHRFCKAFGGCASDPENVILCLPLWRVKDAERHVSRFRKTDFQGLTLEHHGPNDVVSHHDMETALEVASLLDDFTPRPVPMRLDTKEIAYPGKTVVFIASPLVNLRARNALKRLESLPQLPLQVRVQDETEQHPAKLEIVSVADNTAFDSGGAKEYAVVFRVPNPHEARGCWFFVFGAHAEGTFAAGKYLREHWRRFVAAQPIVLVILEMDRGEVASATPVREVGFA